jgi:hypothetical protein
MAVNCLLIFIRNNHTQTQTSKSVLNGRRSLRARSQYPPFTTYATTCWMWRLLRPCGQVTAGCPVHFSNTVALTVEIQTPYGAVLAFATCTSFDWENRRSQNSPPWLTLEIITSSPCTCTISLSTWHPPYVSRRVC